ncbi:MAG: hypothetical protein U0R76_15485 [Candidatus Nanopelagicales bacterium]
MGGLLALVLVGALVVAAALVGGGVVSSFRPVSRERVDRFVDRTGVAVTASNAAFVVDSLARTMRWRTAAVVVAVGVCVAWNVVRATAQFTLAMGVLLAFAFLLGCVAGEVRNAYRRGDGPRAASLVPRREADFIGGWARVWPTGWLIAAVVLGALYVALGRGSVVEAVLAVGVVAVSWGLGRWATRTIVERQRPSSSDPDVLAADDGLRSRALHGVAGAVLLAASWSTIAIGVSAVLPPAYRLDNSIAAVLVWLAMALLARWAWVRATAPFSVVGPPADAYGAPAPAAEGP